jgi:hypothetical protein
VKDLGHSGNLGYAKIAAFSNLRGAECSFPIIGSVVAIRKPPIFPDKKSFTALPFRAFWHVFAVSNAFLLAAVLVLFQKVK